MNIFREFEGVIRTILATCVDQGALPPGLPLDRVAVEPPRDPSHGDLSTNAAMVLAKPAGQQSRQVATLLAERLRDNPHVEAVDVAGPGFVNIRLQPSFWQARVADIIREGTRFGASTMGKGQKVNIEYVSANPTGPMHVGHTRGAIIGDSLANLLQKAGFDVTREYYFNDAGTQVDVLARTTHLRYREALGEDIGSIPEGLYPGEYLKDVGKALVDRDGRRWIGLPESDWLVPVREFAVKYMMDMIRKDLDLIGIHHQVFTNERDLIENGTLDKAFGILQERDLIYTGTLPPPKGKEMEDWEPAPLTLFRSTRFGDSTDRPLKKRDGTWAYIMPDIAYHYDKIRRGFDWMVNLLGTDHGGYLEKMRPVVAAFSDGKAHLDVIFNTIVKVYKNGVLVKLSKRSGNLITLREMVEEVGPGAVRFFMLTRGPETPLEFDFVKVTEQSRDNPVFYVQYAHARCWSVLRHAAAEGYDVSDQALAGVPLAPLTDPDELALVKILTTWPRMVEAAAEAREPHRIPFYLGEVAAAFHGLWNKGKDNAALRFLMADDRDTTLARMAMVRAVALVIASGLEVMGVEPVQEMR
ncbi:MAG: arginine--tRNA ligase [Pseudomonadota bacterium]|nr:arginine--tRNA ligase [Pseudomonadota bacterium]